MMRTPPPLWALDSEGHSRLLGSVAKLAALAQAVVGVSKTYCFLGLGARPGGETVGFFALLSCLLCPFLLFPFLPSCLPGMPLLHRLPGLRLLERPPGWPKLLLFLWARGPVGVQTAGFFFYAMFSNVVGMFLLGIVCFNNATLHPGYNWLFLQIR